MNELDRRARGAFWRALAGALTCCAPLGLWGLYQGLGVKRDAERSNQRVPRLALAAVALGVLSCVVLIAAYFVGREANLRRDQTVAGAVARLEGKRDAVLLERATACDLVTEYLLKTGGSYDAVSCPGPMRSVGGSEAMSGIVATKAGSESKLEACIVRGARWFVLHAEAGVPCPEQLPGPVAATDEDEARAREALKQAAKDAAITTFTGRLAKIRALVANANRAPKACPTAVTAVPESDRRELSFIDFDLLNAGPERADASWAFMTKGDIREVLNPKTSDRSSIATELLKQDALVVFYADHRRWPRMTKRPGFFGDSFAYDAGQFVGWLMVVDMQGATVICQTPLEFSNAAKITYWKNGASSEEGRVESAIEKDFVQHFESAATSTIAELTASRLRLGIKFVE